MHVAVGEIVTVRSKGVLVRASIVKRKLRAGEPVLAAKVNFMSPAVVEMMGTMGYDCLWLGNEHLSADISRIDHMITAARASGMDTMLRRNMAGYHELLQPLELGVHGFMIPRVRSLDYLSQVVDMVKFPPIGHRGLDGVNADADFGLRPLESYLEWANEQTFIVAQIEDASALDLIEPVAQMPGIDVVFVGHGDLALSLGIPGKLREPRVLDAIRRVGQACVAEGKVAGIPSRGPEDAVQLMEWGYRFFTMGADYGFVKNGLLAARDAYRSVGFTFREPAGG
jgi:4-hydroxy-2-oxoheptanedioate aldolase